MKKIKLFTLMILCCAYSKAQTNLMLGYNGDFENGLTGWTWYEVPNHIGSVFELTSDAAHGTHAAKITFVPLPALLPSDFARALDDVADAVKISGNKFYSNKVMLKSDAATAGKIVQVVYAFFTGPNYQGMISQTADYVPLTTTYTEFSKNIFAPANAAYMCFRFNLVDQNGTMEAGTLFVDNCQIYEIKGDIDWVQNGNFEDGTTSFWNFDELGATGPPVANSQSYFDVNDLDPHTGNYSSEIIWSGSTDVRDVVFYQYLPVHEAKTYTGKLWAKSISGPLKLKVTPTFWNGNIFTETDELLSLTDTYTEFTFTRTAPAGATSMGYNIRCLNANGTARPNTDAITFIDDIQWVESSSTALKSVNTVKCSLYPNPASDIIHIEAEQGIKSASIYNISGQKVNSFSSKFSDINVANLRPGIYYVKLKAEIGDATLKLMIK